MLPVTDAAAPLLAHQSTLRETNLAVVLRCVSGAAEPLSRAGVAAATGLTRSTVSRLVDELVAGGLVEEGAALLAGPGRPATPLRPSGRVCALGLQVNAAHVAARLIDLGGRVLAESRSEPDLVGSEPAVALDLLADHLREVLARTPEGGRVVGAGLALPGVVDGSGERLLRAPNLGWRDLAPGAGLRDQLSGIPLSLGNEANLAAHAFAQPAPGRLGRAGHFVYVSGEIGIGGAVVTDHRVQTGRHGFAGEIGHMPFRPGGDPCPCGSDGCLERYAGRLALTRRAGLPPTTTLAELDRLAEDGHAASRAAIDLAAEALGVVLAGVVNLLDVPTIVLGGEIGDLADRITPTVQARLRARVMAADWMPLEVVRDPDDVAGASGGALLHLSRVVTAPVAFLAA
ncbi:ROK family transcriptional regulator [Ornithinimicrobium cerasi]|uniref:Sugar kinase of the NBD/HSP70 family, may contain an N-terminal HTH domain n=1 Tax=Ornithinimicrobium cerasi TaxID=2248773 RepID=A0A285VMK3_9MICO|nr:ROK family transcriptional regulator [Ornithinimicrobium cerasi]SOC53791.1 Sugar kinase of the NBD/HSP70 family, may contain an N-terminal HTH domain [Ornithinimicrobium cerasi]